MSAKRENTAIVGVGVAACAVCCTGPILGFLAAIGLGTAAGFALLGTLAIVIGIAAVAFVLVRRQRRAAGCMPADASAPVPVELTAIPHGTREGGGGRSSLGYSPSSSVDR